MLLYWKIMMNSLQSNTAYRFHTFFTSINRILNLLVQVSLWTALYAGTNLIKSESEISLQQMVLYAVMSTIISIIVSNDNIGNISGKISSGELAINLVRPIGLFRSVLFELIGNKVFTCLFQVAPVLLVAVLFFNFRIPELPYLLAFLASVIFSFITLFLITYLLGLASFWYIRIFHLDFMLNHAIQFFSGAWIPLWFFPDILQKIALFLPFELIYFTPISIYLEQTELSELWIVLLKYVAYILIFCFLNVYVWTKGIKRLVIQGG